jgi:hypothetical protein
MQALRGALADLLASQGDDPRTPQEMSRAHGLNKNLTWKVCKIINATDPWPVVQHVPGAAAIRILLDAYERAGTPSPRLEAVSAAYDRFEAMIRTHAGDRASLQLYVDSTRPEGIHSQELEDKRRLAFQGNGAIWGVQARLGLALRVMSRSPEQPDAVDLVGAAGLLDLRRLRPTASWQVHQRRVLGDDLDPTRLRRSPLEPGGPSEPPLMRRFSTDPAPELRCIEEPDRITYELPEGPVGNTAAIDLVFGTVSRAGVPLHGDEPDAVGEHYCMIDTPLEHVQFDLLIHEDLPFEAPRLVTYSRLHDDLEFPLSRHERHHLPGVSEVQDLGRAPQALASPHMPRYLELIELACAAVSLPVDSFRKYRVSIAYPPMPTMLCMYHPLPPRG